MAGIFWGGLAGNNNNGNMASVQFGDQSGPAFRQGDNLIDLEILGDRSGLLLRGPRVGGSGGQHEQGLTLSPPSVLGGLSGAGGTVSGSGAEPSASPKTKGPPEPATPSGSDKKLKTHDDFVLKMMALKKDDAETECDEEKEEPAENPKRRAL